MGLGQAAPAPVPAPAAAHAGRALGVSRTTIYALLKEARS